MPLTSPAPQAVRIRFEPSVAAELLFLAMAMTGCEHGEQVPDSSGTVEVAGLRVPHAMTRRVADFWGDPVLFWELFVIADEADTLVGPIEPAALRDGWAQACETMPTAPPLRSESAHDREVVHERLRRLQAEPALRRHYVDLMSDIWSAYEEDWTMRWLPRVRRAIDDCRVRRASGSPWESVLKAESRSEIFEAGWDRAHEGGSALVAVCAYGGSLVIDLPGTQFFALSVKDQPLIDRRRSDDLARRLRAISDPTRLALLQLLGGNPRSISELANELDVAQPTVSNHVKVLRQANLVRNSEGAADKRALVVDLEALRALFDEVTALLDGDVAARSGRT